MELKFHSKTPKNKFVSIFTNFFSHMTKMAATTIYGKTPQKLFLQNQKAYDLGTWYVALGCCAYLVYSNDDPRVSLTYKKSRSNLLPNAFQWKVFFYLKLLKSTSLFSLDMFVLFIQTE